MAVIHELQVPGVGSAARIALAVAFWAYYEEHKDERLFSVKFWIISKTVYWHDCYDVFVLIFGTPS